MGLEDCVESYIASYSTLFSFFISAGPLVLVATCRRFSRAPQLSAVAISVGCVGGQHVARQRPGQLAVHRRAGHFRCVISRTSFSLLLFMTCLVIEGGILSYLVFSMSYTARVLC